MKLHNTFRPVGKRQGGRLSFNKNNNLLCSSTPTYMEGGLQNTIKYASLQYSTTRYT